MGTISELNLFSKLNITFENNGMDKLLFDNCGLGYFT